MIDTLLELGFSKNDAAVYEAVVELGPCFVAPLVRHTKKHRQVVYNSLTELTTRHLVTVAQKNGKNHYSISDPQRLLADIKQKEVIAASVVRMIERKHTQEQEQVEFFSGESSHEKGTADFRRRAFEAKEYVVIRSETKAWFEHTRSFFPAHVAELKRFKRSGIDVHIAFFEYEKAEAMQFLGNYLGDPYTCKIIPDEYKLPHTVWLAGEHVYIVTSAVDPIVIHVRSKNLAMQYREYFWRIWKKGEILKKK